MAHTPLKMTIEQAREETISAWARSYSPQRNAEVLEVLKDQPIQYRISHLVARFFFRGIYFPQMNKRAWLKLLYQNRKAIFSLIGEGFITWRKARQEKIRSSVKDNVYKFRA
jgi:hypothetical protein